MIVDGTKYGTDHERYCISGIVRLSDLAEHPHPVPNYHLSPEYAREKTAIQYRLGGEEWEPTSKRNRLTAGLTSNGWMSILRRNNVQLEDGRHYPILEIPRNIDVKINKGAALLAVLRSSVGDGSRLPASTELGVKWCVVDFLLWDISCYEHSAASTQYTAVCSSLKAAAKCTNVSSLPYQASLTPHHNKAIRLACKITALVEPLEPLFTINGFFQTVSLNLWEDARRTWCHEEFGNYLNHMQSQWRDIFLNFDSRVTAATDTETILMLQSRAPAISQEDRTFLAKRFEERLLFPRLTDEKLRAAVKEAVYRQGPILTVKTFASDIKILRARILAPLSEALGPMRARKNTTVRKKLLRYFQERYADYAPTAVGVCAAKERYADQCFERLFLQLMQTATRTLSLSECDIRGLARREFLALNSNTRIESSNSSAEYDELPVEKRHGVKLFKRIAAADSLLSNIIREPCPPGAVSDSFMLRYITSLFLLGTPPPLHLSTSSKISVPTALPWTSSLSCQMPFGGGNSPTQSLSTWSTASKLSQSTWTESHDAWSESAQHMCGDHRQGPRFVTVTDFMSHKGSMHASTVSTTSSEKSYKRHMTAEEDTLFVSEQKRPRLTRLMILDEGSSASSGGTSVYEQQYHHQSHHASIASLTTLADEPHAGDFTSFQYACSTPPSSLHSEDCYQGNAFSPSDYNRSWTPITRRSTTVPPNISSFEQADGYRNLIDIVYEQCDAVDCDQAPASIDARRQNPFQTKALSPTHAIPAVLQGISPRVPPAAKREAIVFQLSGNTNMRYRSTRTLESIRGFVRSQKMVDNSSKFSYMIDGEIFDAPTEALLLKKLATIDVVIVHSERGHFASTQHPSIVHY